MFWTLVAGWNNGGVVVAADDLAAWLISLLADAGRKKLTTFVSGTDREWARRSAATSAVRLTAEELRRGGLEQAEHVALVMSQIFSGQVPDASLVEHKSVLAAMQAGGAGQLAVLPHRLPYRIRYADHRCCRRYVGRAAQPAADGRL